MKDPDIRIDTIGGQCPVQAEGAINAQPFYFRARGAGWSMSIGGKNPVTEPEWFFWAPYPDLSNAKEEDGRSLAAGWMTEEAARSFIYTAAMLYAVSKKSTLLKRFKP